VVDLAAQGVSEEPAEPVLAMPAAPREITEVTSTSVGYLLPEDGPSGRTKSFTAPAGTKAPVPLADGEMPQIGEDEAEKGSPDTNNPRWAPSGNGFSTVGRRNVSQRQISRLQQENGELKSFILQRGRQVEGLYAELHESFLGMAARMEAFQTQFAILVEDHRLAATAIDKASDRASAQASQDPDIPAHA